MSRIVCGENNARRVRERLRSVECDRVQSQRKRAAYLTTHRANDAVGRCVKKGPLKIGTMLTVSGLQASGRALRILDNEMIWIAIQVSRYLESVLIALRKVRHRSRSAFVWTVAVAAA